MFQHYGCVRLREIMRCTTLERVRMSHTRGIEHLARLCGEQTRARARVVDQWIIVVDAEGWDPANLLTPAVFKWATHMADVDQNHHPERLFRMFIINTPRVVFTFYKMISGLIAESTRAKIQLFIGAETWMPALAEHRTRPAAGRVRRARASAACAKRTELRGPTSRRRRPSRRRNDGQMRVSVAFF